MLLTVHLGITALTRDEVFHLSKGNFSKSTGSDGEILLNPPFSKGEVYRCPNLSKCYAKRIKNR